MADVIYNSFKAKIMDGTFDLDAGAIWCELVTSSYVPDADTHDFRSSVTSEVTGTGYTAGGAVLAGYTVFEDTTDNEGVFDANDLTWQTSTITARGAVLYKSTGNSTTDPIICYIDFGADKSSSSGDFTIQWNSEGILNLN